MERIGQIAMTENLQPKREVAGIFDSPENLDGAVDDLLSSGFDRAEISLLGEEGAIDKQLGHVIERQDGSGTETRSVYVSEEETGQARKLVVGSLAAIGGMAGGAAVVATGGALAPAFLAALLTGGAAGVAGDAATRIFAHERTEELKRRVRDGGIVLFVSASGAKKEALAIDTLSRHSPYAVSSHVVDDAAPS